MIAFNDGGLNVLKNGTLVVGDPRSMEWFLEQPAKSKEGPQNAVVQLALNLVEEDIRSVDRTR
jgi:hypothetical protein